MSNDNIKGLQWEEKSSIPNNNIIARLEEYCNKYNVQLYGRPLNFEFVLELIEKVENWREEWKNFT